MSATADGNNNSEQIVEAVRRSHAETVFIGVSAGNVDATVELIRKLAPLPVAVRVIPEIPVIGLPIKAVSLRDGVPVLHIADVPLRPIAACVKRMEDIILAILLLALMAPIMLLAGFAIWLESGRPIVFKQPRQGLGGQEIGILKFRTMYTKYEDRRATRQTVRADPRITRAGAFLRRHSLDELPQLVNVLGGSMSLVGPRPHTVGTTAAGQALERAVANYTERHRVKPGLTGWAQVNGHRGILDSVEKAVRRVEHDLYYIEHWSLLLDLKILLRTIGVVVHDDKAY
jgi:exopolysaccharide biosynthesis polyprenyl glycosylphosphotransferase